MTRRFQQIVLSWLLVLAIGGHWPLLQSVAWVNMLVSFSQTEDLKTAVEKTFSGKHPCKICSLIAKGKQTEQKQAAHAPLVKFDFFLVESEPFLPRIPSAVRTGFLLPALHSQLRSPDSPPPRHG